MHVDIDLPNRFDHTNERIDHENDDDVEENAILDKKKIISRKSHSLDLLDELGEANRLCADEVE